MKIFRYLFRFIAVGCGAIIVFVFVTNAVIYFGTRAYIYETISDVPDARAAVIPGAAVFSNGVLSSVFKDRVDVAIKLYKTKKVSKILVSGDNSTVSHNEVNPVRLYLLDHGIPDRDIFLDHAGFDTYSTMYRARDIFRVDSIIITTQPFHLPRAVFIARRLGITAYGASADSGQLPTRNYIREIFADEKAVLDLMFGRKPKYLGDQIPITGDGRDSS
jgi:SanA protein